VGYDVDELVTKFRRDMEDTVEPYLWADEEILEYLEEAQDEFIYITNGISAEVTLSFSADDSTVMMPEYITRIRSAENASNAPMTLYNWEEWSDASVDDDYSVSGINDQWRLRTAPVPTKLITDVETGTIRLYPIPEEDGNVILQVYRLPIISVVDDEEMEVTGRKQQRVILIKVRSLAYDKQDSQTYNPQQSDALNSMFEERADKYKTRKQRSTRRAKSVSYGGI